MTSDTPPTRCAPPRCYSYQRYLEARDSTANILIGLFAGRAGLLRIQRRQNLKYFESLHDPSNSEGSENEETKVAKEVKSGYPVRHNLSREDSKISNSGTSYYSATSCQSIKEEEVIGHEFQTQLPIFPDIPELSGPYTISIPAGLQHVIASSQYIVHISVANSRPKRYLDLDADCAEAAKWPTPPETPPPSPPPTTIKVHPLTTYLSQENKATRWDIRDWIHECAAYEKEARERVRKPTHLLQCPEYYMMENFNPLSVHKPWYPREERTNQNMAIIMMSTGWAAEPTIHSRIQQARMNETRKAQARTAKGAIIAEAAFFERQTRKARQVPEGLKKCTKPGPRKPAESASKVHFASCEVPRTASKASEVPETALKPIAETPTPTDAMPKNERFKIERSAPIDIPKPSKYRGGPKVLSENMRRGMRLIAASQIP